MADTVYRFLPWARRGLAAAIPVVPSGPLPARATLGVQIEVSGLVDPIATTTVLHGPGDVIGLDPAQIVRIWPRPHTTDAEPNYLAAVDLDAPELPWLFTPQGGTPGRLPPWLVLIVVEQRTGVAVTVPRGAPLPQLRIETGAADELPDLADSWAWAHVQMVEPAGGAGVGAAVGTALGAQPDRNVARVVCPRRLAPNRSWIAALVPAFDAGVVRGLGGTPRAGDPLGPAWVDPDLITLPTYFHWEFQTGPEGDFESLAQRLKPHRAGADVGRVPMHVGEASPILRVPADQARHLPMDGALRATAQNDGRLDEVAEALQTGLRDVSQILSDAADGVIDGQVIDERHQPVGPPVYASEHVRRWRVREQDVEWFRELNLDPRPRVAGWLGAECVRDNQEEIANAAWMQVGAVLELGAALQRAALAKLISASFHRRHLLDMRDDQLLGLVGPAVVRLPFEGRSMVAAIARSSLPDAVVDAGLRRALSPSGLIARRAAKRLSAASTSIQHELIPRLAAGLESSDPTRFDMPALTGVLTSPLNGDDLAPLGLPLQVDRRVIHDLASVASRIAATQPAADVRLQVRSDLRERGMLGQVHVDAARAVATSTGDSMMSAIAGGADPDVRSIAAVATSNLMTELLAAAGRLGSGVGLSVLVPNFARGSAALADATNPIDVARLDLGRDGVLVAITEPGGPAVPVAEVGEGVAGLDLATVVSELQPGSFSWPARARPQVLPRISVATAVMGSSGVISVPGRSRVPGRGAAGRVPSGASLRGTALSRATVGGVGRRTALPVGSAIVVDGAPGTDAAGTTMTMATPIRDTAVIGMLEMALAAQATTTSLATPVATATVVTFSLANAATVVRRHLDPNVAQPLRRDALLRVADTPVGRLHDGAHSVDSWWATRQIDRVMAYPRFDTPLSRYLATYDQARFCPGIDEIPRDSVSLLETNPRFIAAFMAGANHEVNRELLWRGYPTDGRGTPFRRFWAHLDGLDDIPPIHQWRLGSLAEQTSNPKGNLVLLVRGDLLRRHPNTIVLAIRATGPRTPSEDARDVEPPIFAGQFDPDVSFFGFALTDKDLQDGEGWFFALMEPVTEPRFGLDETENQTGENGGSSDGLSWLDAAVAPGGHLGRSHLAALGLHTTNARSDDLARALLQRPFALYVHARHLVVHPDPN